MYVKQVLLYAVLSAVALLQIPRAVLHDHDHGQDHDCNAHDTEVPQFDLNEDGDCYFCDFQLYPFTVSEPLEFYVNGVFGFDKPVNSLSFILVPSRTEDHRGPPSVA